jgi:hypothetical protein
VIQDTTAFAKFAVSFECIVFRPFKGEVLDCVVTSVNKARCRGCVRSAARRVARRLGLAQHSAARRSAQRLTRVAPARADGLLRGGGAHAGVRLQLRTTLLCTLARARTRMHPRARSRSHTPQLIPEDMSFNSVDEPCYVSTDEMARRLTQRSAAQRSRSACVCVCACADVALRA